MITPVKIENRRRNWKGEEIVHTEEYTQIEGSVTSVGDDGTPIAYLGNTPIYTIDAGDTIVTVASPGGLATDMRPVAVGDRVRVLATGDSVAADYCAATIDRI